MKFVNKKNLKISTMDNIIRENRAVFVNFISFDLYNGLLNIRYSYNMTMYAIITKITSYITVWNWKIYILLI